MDFFERDNLPAEQWGTHFFLQFMLGAGRSFQAPWLKHLWDTEKDPEWKRDMVCAEKDWVARVFQTNMRFADEGVLERRSGSVFLYQDSRGASDGITYSALLYRNDPESVSAGFDYISAGYIEHMIDSEMALWGGAGSEAYDWDRKTEGQYRHDVCANPDNAQAHLNLGVYLGINGHLPSHLEEGYRECMEAIELRPTWDLPRIEVANILLRVGNSVGALAVLKNAARELGRTSPRLAYTIGFAKMMNQDFAGALGMFEIATQMKPDYALAFDNAAYCSYRLGDTIKGRRYAKSARQLGISTTYDMYDVGKTKDKEEELPFKILCETVPCREKNCKSRVESEQLRHELLQKYRNGTQPTNRP